MRLDMNKKKYVVMFGSSLESPGGISAVVNTYKQAGLFEQANIKYISTYSSPNKLSILFYWSMALYKLLLMLILRQVICVHVHSASRGSFWRKASLVQLAHFFKVKTIFHLHSGEFLNFYLANSKIVQNYITNVLSKVSYVIALSKSMENIIYEMAPQANVRIIFNPVMCFDNKYKKRTMQIVFLGRLRESKGLFELIDACSNIIREYPDLKLVLAGDGDLDEIEGICKNKLLSNNVVLPGWVEGSIKEKYLLESEIFVLPSYYEGLPIGVLEAMANNIPVIATTVGGIPDVIDTGHDGLLVPPKNTNELQSAIVKLLNDEPLRNKLSSNAFDKACKEFSVTKINNSLLNIYSNSMEEGNIEN